MFNWFKRKPELKSYRTPEVDRAFTTSATWSEWDAEKAVEEGFKANVPVYSCVKKLMDSIASVPLKVETFQSGEWEETPSHPLQALLNNPNPDMSTAELVKLYVAHLSLAGNAYWMKVRGGRDNNTMELWPAMPQHVQIYKGTDRFVDYYGVGTTQKRVDFEDMCHFKYSNPNSFYFGQSPLQAAGKAVDVDNAGQAFQKVSMQNRGVPDLHISFDEQLTEEQHEQAKKVIDEKISGTANARGALVTSKATAKQLSQTPVEMDFMNTRRFSREEVCGVYGVPSALIAEMGAVNLANAETARKLFWLDTITPMLDGFVDSLNHCLVADEYGPTVRIVYDTSNVAALQENYGEKLTNAKILWSMGVPFNEVNSRLQLGFDDMDGGDIGYIPTGVIPSTFDFGTEVDEETKAEVFQQIIKAHKNAAD